MFCLYTLCSLTSQFYTWIWTLESVGHGWGQYSSTIVTIKGLTMKIAYTYEKNVVRKRPLFSWILLCFSTLNLFAILYVIITITEFTCLFLLNFVPIGPKFTQHFIRLLSRWLKVTKKVTKSLKKIMKKMWCLQHVVFPSGHPSKY